MADTFPSEGKAWAQAKTVKKRAGNARPYDIGLSADHARRGDHWSPVVPVSSASATPGTGNMRIGTASMRRKKYS